MTSRMTVALWVVSAGLAIAALAGIPALIENRSVGDVVVVVGFAVAIAGGMVMLTGIPAQRRSRAEAARSRQADIADLRVKRKRIIAQLANVKEQIQKIDSSMLMRTTLRSTIDSSDDVATRRLLEVERINLEAELATNANDLRRLGEEP